MSDTQNQNQQKEGETAEVLGAPQATVLKTAIPDALQTEKKDPEGFKKLFDNVGKINIKAFVDNTKENMGLEKYDMSIFPGTFHVEQLAAIERHGIVQYITGLDEFASEIQLISDTEMKEAIIYNIRSVVAHLEKLLATNVLKVDDPDFWSKVKLLRPDNHSFWSTITISCGNEPVFLDPGKDPFDLIKYMAIEAGGFDIIAKSYDDALARPVAPKFFLDKEVHTIGAKTSGKRLRNAALGILNDIANKNPKKLLYITKTLDTNSASYKNSTAPDILYDAMDNYIMGNGVERSSSKAAELFMTTAKLDMETLKLKAIVKDGAYFKTISLKADGMLYHTKTNTVMGRNVSDVLLYLKNPLHEDILMPILREVEEYWK